MKHPSLHQRPTQLRLSTLNQAAAIEEINKYKRVDLSKNPIRQRLENGRTIVIREAQGSIIIEEFKHGALERARAGSGGDAAQYGKVVEREMRSAKTDPERLFLLSTRVLNVDPGKVEMAPEQRMAAVDQLRSFSVFHPHQVTISYPKPPISEFLCSLLQHSNPKGNSSPHVPLMELMQPWLCIAALLLTALGSCTCKNLFEPVPVSPALLCLGFHFSEGDIGRGEILLGIKLFDHLIQLSKGRLVVDLATNCRIHELFFALRRCWCGSALSKLARTILC